MTSAGGQFRLYLVLCFILYCLCAIREQPGAARLTDTDLSPKKAPVPGFCLYSVVFSREESTGALWAMSKPGAAALRSEPQQYLVSAD